FSPTKLPKSLSIRTHRRCATVEAQVTLERSGKPRRVARIPEHSTCQHVIRQAVAVARLVGVPTPVHVRQIEGANGAQHAAGREEFADRGGAPHLDAENIIAVREEITDVFWRRDAVLEKRFVQMALRG